MDLIGSIHYIENRLEQRKRGQDKAAQKKPRSLAPDGKPDQTGQEQASTEHDGRLGQKIDTTA